jgi:hypothetical protein
VLKLCVSPEGGILGDPEAPSAKVWNHLADVHVLDHPCRFDHDPNPCTSPVCADPRTKDLCNQFTAEYCVEHPTDGACELLVFHYERLIGDVEVLLHLPQVGFTNAGAPSAKIYILPADCGCDIDCVGRVTTLVPEVYTQGVPNRLGEGDKMAAGFGNALVNISFFVPFALDWQVCANTNPLDETDFKLAATITALKTGSCVFAAQGSPCFLEACTDEDSDECQLAILSYCSANPQDGGCSYYTPVFKRNSSEATSVAIYLSASQLDVRNVHAVHEACACDDTSELCEAPEFEVSNVHFDPISRFVEIDFAVYAIGTYKLCDDLGLLAKVETDAFTLSCSFTFEPSPCTAEACVDRTSTACAQFTAEYCSQHPLDKGCGLVKVLFQRRTGVLTSITLHHDGGKPDVTVGFAPMGCGCSAECQMGADVFESAIDLTAQTMALTVQFYKTGTYELCSNSGIKGNINALVEVEGESYCVFDAEVGTPCVSDLCAAERGGDPFSDECQQLTALYCAQNDFDGGCEVFALLFVREVDTLGNVSVHIKGGTSELSARFVPMIPECECGSDCSSREVSVTEAVYDTAAGALRLAFVGSRVGTYRVCVSPLGGLDPSLFTTFVGLVEFRKDCPFDATADTPCTWALCQDPLQQDACMAATAEYCLEHPEDTGCSLLVIGFERELGAAAEISVHYDASEGSFVEAYFALPHCSCEQGLANAAGCEDKHEVEVLAATYDVATKVVTVEFLPHALDAGYRLCVTDTMPQGRLSPSWVAKLDVTGPSCVFAAGDGTPCTNAACADPTSEACLAVMGEYCYHERDGSCSDDPACALIVPVYTRTVGQETSLSIFTPAELAMPYFVPEDCECRGACNQDDVLVQKTTFLRAGFTATFTPRQQGRYKMCASEFGVVAQRHVATLHAVHPVTCVFALDDSSPCEAPSCQPGGDADVCMQVTAAYCAARGLVDGGCALFIPAFERVVEEPAMLSLHLKDLGRRR